jgi:carbamoyltransferase
MNIVSLYDSPFSSFVTHDRSAAIISGNKIYAYEEAKLSTVKEDGYAISAERSILAGFKELNISPDDIDFWVFPKVKNFKVQLKTLNSYFKNIFGTNKFEKYCNLKNYNKKFIFFDHHELHMALAGFTSPFKKCLTVSMDGGGDYADHNHLVAKIFDRQKYYPLEKRILELKGPNGVANFHGWLTESIGFLEDGKTSGLASYGKVQKKLYQNFDRLFKKDKNGISIFLRKRVPFNIYNFSKIKLDSHERKKFVFHQPGITNVSDLVESYYPEDIAKTGSQIIQDKLIETIRVFKKKFPKIDKIALVGGLFNNVRLNQAIVESNIFKKVHFTMNPGDGGLTLGGALLANHIKSEKKENKFFQKKNYTSIFSPYIGPSFNNSEIEEILIGADLKFKKYSFKDLTKVIAKHIANGKVIGTFWGRGEYGPRSLGHRSILADPRIKNIKTIINQKLKKRDWFMPFAPAILDNYVKNYSKLNYKCPYMQVSFPCNDKAKKEITSSVHVDGTARIQSVSKKTSPFFYNIINNFKKISKLPVVLNTSFNRHGISTISTPRQALEHFLMGTCDILVLENFILELSKNRITNKKNKTKIDKLSKLIKFTHKTYFKKREIKNKYILNNKL